MKSFRKLSIWLIVIGVLLYLPSWFNGFVWDDEEQIVNNPFITSINFLPYIFSGSTFGGGGTSLPTGGYYKPLMSIWFMVNHMLFGLGAGGYHFTQSGLHAVNAVLLFMLLITLSKKKLMAFGVALGWLIHPGNVESVAYAASAQEVLSTFFGLLALLIVVNRQRLKLDDITALFIANGVWLLSMLSKESGAVFFVVISAYLIIIEKSWKLVKFYWLLWLPMLLVYSMLRFGVAKVFLEPHSVIPVAQLSFGERMLTMIETLWQHVRVVFFPLQLHIGHHQVVNAWSFELGIKLVAIVLVLFILVFVSLQKKNVLSWFFLIWLIASVGLTSNIFPLDMTYAERWSYTPIMALGGWILSQGIGFKVEGRTKKVFVGCFAFLLITFSIRTVFRQLDWHDGLRLYSKDLRYAQNAFDLENNYGVELMRANRIGEAKVHFEKSILLAPAWWTNYNNLGVVYQREGSDDKAIEMYQKAIDNGHYHLAYENLALILAKRNDPRVKQVLEQGLTQLPNNETLRYVQSVYLNR